MGFGWGLMDEGSDDRFADGMYAVILGESGRVRDIDDIVTLLSEGFNGNVRNVTINRRMNGKDIFDYGKWSASDSFWKTFGDERGNEIMAMAYEWAKGYCHDGEPVRACPRIVVADVTPEMFDGRLEEVVGEKWRGFCVFRGGV